MNNNPPTTSGCVNQTTVGMTAFTGGKIINNGVIDVHSGVGMLVYSNGILENNNIINVDNGLGIQVGKNGKLVNKGIINVTGTGKAEEITGTQVITDGGVTITNNGVVTIDGNTVTNMGTIKVDGNLVVDGVFVDVTTGKPAFVADSVTGTISSNMDNLNRKAGVKTFEEFRDVLTGILKIRVATNKAVVTNYETLELTPCGTDLNRAQFKASLWLLLNKEYLESEILRIMESFKIKGRI